MKYWDVSWNPITGCSPCSPGCLNCWAKRMAYRLKGRYGYPTDNPFKVTFHPERLNDPLKWKKPKRIFVCDMGDLFHKDVKEEWFIPIMHKIRLEANQHTYFFLTKRPQNIENYLCNWFLQNLPNLWLGVTVCNQEEANEKIPILLQIPAVHKWVSIEPYLGKVNLIKATDTNYINELHKCGIGIDWVVLGGETGPKAKSLHPDWVRSVRDQCQAAGVSFFFKQWGDYEKRYNKGSRYDSTNTGRLLDGREWNEMPK